MPRGTEALPVSESANSLRNKENKNVKKENT
jgi:hypothetical protein